MTSAGVESGFGRKLAIGSTLLVLLAGLLVFLTQPPARSTTPTVAIDDTDPALVSPAEAGPINDRAQAYLQERMAEAQAAPGSTSALDAASDPNHMPWVGSYRVWCTYSNPGGSCSNYHTYPAMDVEMAVGTPIYAAGAGRVVGRSTGCVPGDTACGGGGGNYVVIAHVDTSTGSIRLSRYLHLSRVDVSLNADLVRGQQLGLSGWTGRVSPTNVTAAHLHYDEQATTTPGSSFGTAVDPGDMFQCIGGAPVKFLQSHGWATFGSVPYLTSMRNDDFDCNGGQQPDADGDGVLDVTDLCPDVAGPSWSDGCDLESSGTARVKADFNGDGLGDIALLDSPGTTGSAIYVMPGRAGGGVGEPELRWSTPSGWQYERTRMVTGDFTRDGYDDVVLLYDLGGAQEQVYIAYGYSGGLMAPQLLGGSSSGGIDLSRAKLVGGDFDGDGYADVGFFVDNGSAGAAFWISRGTPGGPGAPSWVWDSGAGGWPWPGTRAAAGDVNGDGRADLVLTRAQSNSQLTLWVANGNADGGITAPSQQWDSGAGGADPRRTRMTAGDFDGDGRADVVLVRGYDGSRVTAQVAYANGLGFNAPRVVWDSGAGAFDLQRVQIGACDTGGTGRASLGLWNGKADASTSLTVLAPTGSGGFAAPSTVWQRGAGMWNGTRTKFTGCDLAPPVHTSKFHGLTPARLLDSRDGTGGYSTAWSSGAVRDVQVTGVGGVPTTGVSGVVLNVTVTAGSNASHLTVWPSGLAQPMASNLNFVAGQTVANQVVVKMGYGGKVSIYNNAGNVHVIADVIGYFDGDDGDSFYGLTPARVLDSRDGTGGSTTPWGPQESRDVTVTGVGGVPTSGVDAVVMNLTVDGGTAPSHLSVWPSGLNRPMASTLNFDPGKAVPNLVVATVGSGGRVSIFNNAGTTNVIADVVGYFGPGSGGRFVALPPGRVLDSRFGIGSPSQAWGPGETRAVDVSAVGGVPATGARSVVMNVTVVGASAASHLAVWPSGLPKPRASNLNFDVGQTVPNVVVVPIGADGNVAVFNNAGNVHVIADIIGYYQ